MDAPGKNAGVGPFPRESSQPRDGTWVSCIAGGFLTIRTTWEAHEIQETNAMRHIQKSFYWVGRGLEEGEVSVIWAEQQMAFGKDGASSGSFRLRVLRGGEEMGEG